RYSRRRAGGWRCALPDRWGRAPWRGWPASGALAARCRPAVESSSALLARARARRAEPAGAGGASGTVTVLGRFEVVERIRGFGPRGLLFAGEERLVDGVETDEAARVAHEAAGVAQEAIGFASEAAGDGLRDRERSCVGGGRASGG